MDIQAEKLKLLQAVLNIEDIDLVIELEELLKGHQADWFEDLNTDQQQSVIRGLDQADKGETISHAEAVARLGL